MQFECLFVVGIGIPIGISIPVRRTTKKRNTAAWEPMSTEERMAAGMCVDNEARDETGFAEDENCLGREKTAAIEGLVVPPEEKTSSLRKAVGRTSFEFLLEVVQVYFLKTRIDTGIHFNPLALMVVSSV